MRLVPALLLLAFSLPVAAASAAEGPIEVRVEKNGDTIVVDVTAHVEASHGVTWAVLTDYDRMADFVSALRESRIVSRNGHLLEVAQTGGAKRGFFDFTFTSLRAVELVPESEIRSRLIRGDFKSYEFTTRLAPADAPGVVTIKHHGEYRPNLWVPPVVGPALIQAETRKQYGELISEITRRQSAERGDPRAPTAASAPSLEAPPAR